MAKVLAIANQKAVWAKPPPALTWQPLVATKRKVLLIDLDPQGNATMGSGVTNRPLQRSVYDVLMDECSSVMPCKSSENGGYQLLPANGDLTAAEVQLLEMKMKEAACACTKLSAARDKFDFILIDCPPALSMSPSTRWSPPTGDHPMQCEYYALEGLSDLVNTIQRIGAGLNPSLKIEGCCVPCTTRASAA